MGRKYNCSVPNCVYNTNNAKQNNLHCPYNGELNAECKSTWIHDSFVNEKSVDSYYDFYKLEWTELNHPNQIIQCAACDKKSYEKNWFNSAVHTKFKICPICGTVRFICDENKGYRK